MTRQERHALKSYALMRGEEPPKALDGWIRRHSIDVTEDMT